MKDKIITIRLSEEQYTKLKEKAIKKTKGNISRLIKNLINQNSLSPLERSYQELFESYKTIYQKLYYTFTENDKTKNDKLTTECLKILQSTTQKFLDEIRKLKI